MRETIIITALLLHGCHDAAPTVEARRPVMLASYECESVTISGFGVSRAKVVDIAVRKRRPDRATWYDCTKTFDDGTWFRRIGDARP